MAKLTDAQIATAAKAAGFSGDALVTAVAVALAESSGDPRAHNPRGLDNSYGLWQINMRGDMGPARRRQFGLTSNDQLFDPVTNAKAAYAISSGGKNWKPWSTYTNLAYRPFVNRARLASGATAELPSGTTQTGVGTSGGGVVQVDFTPNETGAVQIDLGWGDLADPFGIVPDGEGGTLGGGLAGKGIVALFMQWTAALVKGAAWMGDPANWARVAQVLAGAGLLITGVSVMARPAVQSAAGAVGKVASVTPIGRAGKLAAAAS